MPHPRGVERGSLRWNESEGQPVQHRPPAPPIPEIVELALGGRSVLELGPAIVWPPLISEVISIVSWLEAGGMAEGVWGIWSCWLSPVTRSANRQKAEGRQEAAAVQGLFLCHLGWFCTSS